MGIPYFFSMKKKLLTILIGILILIALIGGIVIVILNATNKPRANAVTENNTTATIANNQLNNTTKNSTVTPTPNPNAPLLTTQISIVTLGDSITTGEGDPTLQGYQGPLKDYMQSIQLDSQIKNYGVKGASSGDISSQVAKTVQEKPKVALILIGSNDLLKFYQANPEPTSQQESDNLNTFSNNISSIVGQITQNGVKTYVGLLDDLTKRPAFATLQLRQQTFPTIKDSTIPKISAQVKKYNDSIRATAQNTGAFVVDFYSTTIFSDPSKVSVDGLHPNTKG